MGKRTDKIKSKVKSNPKKVIFAVLVIVLALVAFVGVRRHKKSDGDLNITTSAEQTVSQTMTQTSETQENTVTQADTTTSETVSSLETSSEVITTQEEKDPLKFSKEQILVYLNSAANKVRTQRPGFNYVEKSTASGLKVNDSNSKILSVVAEKIIAFFLKDHEAIVKKGEKSAPIEDYALTTYFGSEQADWALNLKPEDITSAKVTKEGNNYRVTVSLIEELNPKKNGDSAYSRGMLILTIDDILKIAHDEGDGVFGGKMSIEMKNDDSARLYYREGYISALIDPNGNMVEMDSKFMIDACGKNFTLKIGNPEKPLIKYTCKQFDLTIGKEYIQKDFKW